MRILITGALGQLGRAMQKALAQETLILVDVPDWDITDPNSVSAMADMKPDVVIHCAAMTDVDGCERDPETAHKVNALGTRNVALACQRSGAAMLYVSTDYVFDGTSDQPYLEYDEPNPISVYARSKLANVLFSYELARRLDGSGVSANALHPGHVATDMWKTSFPVVGPVLKWVMGFFALTPEQGADNTIYLASSPEVEGISGEYYVKREPSQSSPLSYDEAIAQRLWEVSEELTAPNSYSRVEPA